MHTELVESAYATLGSSSMNVLTDVKRAEKIGEGNFGYVFKGILLRVLSTANH